MTLAPADRALIHDTAHVLAIPRAEPANSFVLHASLELMARASLLPLVLPDRKEAARERLRTLATSYEAAGDPVEPPPPVDPDPDRLVAALRAGDLDEVDAHAVALGEVVDAAELRALLAGPILRSLGAAAHGSILVHLLTRGAETAGLPLGLARQALREMARTPSWQLRWFDDPDEPEVTATLAGALADVPHLGAPAQGGGIYPLMHQAEETGLAPSLLAGIAEEPGAAETVLARVAAWSMLQDAPDVAPYGWSHCLTMPQATIRLADRSPHAVHVAATYVVGFRAAFGQMHLDPDWSPHPESPEAATWSEPSDRTVGELAGRAAAHEDAHLAKYTLACIDAAAHDPAARHLHLAAAARLSRWWREHDEGDADG